ncbi:hypothetical protein ABIG06_000422 [Bradyrhizobium sp. USDA 326]|uniref:cytochrome P450 n=1 Tax=unclassified Bradyrhizobium TaxID=2631580 RepID=UPI003513B1BA
MAALRSRQLVILSTMSAARDEEAYERPDVFDIRRTDQPRLLPAFGAGAHRCIGEALARIELEESLAALAARIPQLRLDEAPAIKGHSGIRRVETMRISGSRDIRTRALHGQDARLLRCCSSSGSRIRARVVTDVKAENPQECF